MQIKGMWYNYSEVMYEWMPHYDFQDVNMLTGKGFRHVLHVVLQVTRTPDFDK